MSSLALSLRHSLHQRRLRRYRLTVRLLSLLRHDLVSLTELRVEVLLAPVAEALAEEVERRQQDTVAIEEVQDGVYSSYAAWIEVCVLICSTKTNTANLMTATSEYGLTEVC